MRIALVVIALLAVHAMTDSAAADPYRWCAEYGVGGDAGTNCYFMTLQQCQAAASGVGGICRPNPFYDGRPVTGPGEPTSQGKRSRR